MKKQTAKQYREQIEKDITTLKWRVRSLEENETYFLEQLEGYQRVLGPLWKTQNGHMTVPALMSDNHLAAVLEGNFGNIQFRKACLLETLKRSRDDDYWKEAGSISPRALCAKLSRWLRWIL